MAAGSLGKGRHKRYRGLGANFACAVYCPAETGAALGCCGHPARHDLMGALSAPGIIPPVMQPGMKDALSPPLSVQEEKPRRRQAAALPTAVAGQGCCQPPLRRTPHGDGKAPRFSQPVTHRSAGLPASRSHGCSPPAWCPIPPGWDMWPGPGTVPGAE